MAGRPEPSIRLERGRQERAKVGMSGLCQGGVDGYETSQFEEEDGCGQRKVVEKFATKFRFNVCLIGARGSEMSDFSLTTAGCDPQEAIRAKCFHPSGTFVEFRKEEIEQSIPSRFEQQVGKYLDRIAVKTINHTLTYDALNKMANRVAQAMLRHQGKGNEPVAMLIESDAPMIAATIGVLKAGKICVPLDPSHPQARITYILKESEARLILTNNKNLARAKEMADDGCQAVNIDDLDTSLPDKNLGRSYSADTSAFILYTSGSTGEPKGVIQNYRNLLHNVMKWTNDFRICPDDRLSFVGSARRDIFRALLNGGAVYPLNLKEEGLARMGRWLMENGITILHSVPTPFRHFLDTLTGKERFPALRLIVLLGGPLYARDVELYRRHFSPTCILVNSLGSTETRNYTYYCVDKDTQITESIVPVGRVVEDSEVLLFNEAGEPIGFNQVGEIAVKSRYLSPGYWRKPDLTRGLFRPHPKGGNERLYFTGDLALTRPDGCLIYVGRKDFQVKIRGHRVEIAEVESALLDHNGIKEVAVVASESRTEDKRLIAYFVPSRRSAPTVGELRSFLKEKLPDYMIPSAFVMLRALPLTPNGKIDRRALPAPDQTRPEVETTFVAARDALELQLTHIWEKILGIQPIGLKDNFFDLGGHSLLAAQLIAQVEKVIGKNLPLATLFQAPTVEQLARILRQKGWSAPWSLLVPLQLNKSKPPFFCHGASLEMALHVGADQPFYGLQPHGQDGRRAPSTVEEMAADYFKEIRTIQPEGPYFLGGYSFGGIVAFEMAQQLQKQGQKVALLVLIDPAGPNNDLSPHRVSSAVNITPFRHETYQHLHNLARLGLREKLTYISERMKWRLDEINRKIKMMVCRFYLRIGKRVPPRLRMFYFFEVGRHARQKYAPQIYPGRIIFLKAERSSLEWSGLAAEGLEIHEVPGRHLDLLRAAHAQVIGENLRACLEQAQATLSAKTINHLSQELRP